MKRGRKKLQAARLERVDAIAEQLLLALERAAAELDAVVVSCRDKTKTEIGEEIREYQLCREAETGPIDRAGLKQLTGVLKDLKEVLMLRSEADLQEQEARIAKLQRELQKDAPQRLTVTMEGDSDAYAR